MIKYPRTYHLPYSPGRSSDDKVHSNLDFLNGKKLVATIKMDGENTTFYRDGIHARSLSSRNHPSRNWVKNLWSTIAHEIPEGWRICGENVYAQHSIHYEDLKSYFYVFSIWNERNECLSWEDTKIYAEMLGLITVDEVAVDFTVEQLDDVHKAFKDNFEGQEGYVIRNAEPFHYDDFKNNVGKFVRENHVQTDSHWMFKEVVPNGLLSVDE